MYAEESKLLIREQGTDLGCAQRYLSLMTALKSRGLASHVDYPICRDYIMNTLGTRSNCVDAMEEKGFLNELGESTRWYTGVFSPLKAPFATKKDRTKFLTNANPQVRRSRAALVVSAL